MKLSFDVIWGKIWGKSGKNYAEEKRRKREKFILKCKINLTIAEIKVKGACEEQILVRVRSRYWHISRRKKFNFKGGGRGMVFRPICI
jgi:hypothetical protein